MIFWERTQKEKKYFQYLMITIEIYFVLEFSNVETEFN